MKGCNEDLHRFFVERGEIYKYPFGSIGLYTDYSYGGYKFRVFNKDKGFLVFNEQHITADDMVSLSEVISEMGECGKEILYNLDIFRCERNPYDKK